MATVYREVWTGEVVRAFSHAEQTGFLQGIKDQSRYVTGNDEAQVIHMAFLGVKPSVLINNTTYPIAIVDMSATDVPIALDKYQTEATPITDDELYALSYDKIRQSSQSHSEAIMESRHDKALHAFAPASHELKTPVLKTTGADDGTGRRRLTWADLIKVREAFAKARIPTVGMRLVLCQAHVNDLLLTDEKFKDQYYNRTTGVISNQLGFEIYEYAVAPLYNTVTGAKKSFASLQEETDSEASVFFHPLRVVKAAGVTKMYWKAAETDPQNQQNLMNYRNYFIALPVAEEAIGAIYSDLIVIEGGE